MNKLSSAFLAVVILTLFGCADHDKTVSGVFCVDGDKDFKVVASGRLDGLSVKLNVVIDKNGRQFNIHSSRLLKCN